MDGNLWNMTFTIVVIIYIMAYGLHRVMISRKGRLTRLRSRFHMMITLERGDYGVIKTLRVHPRRKTIINEGFFLDTILGRGEGLTVTQNHMTRGEGIT